MVARHSTRAKQFGCRAGSPEPAVHVPRQAGSEDPALQFKLHDPRLSAGLPAVQQIDRSADRHFDRVLLPVVPEGK
jgi:hypothetical protein